MSAYAGLAGQLTVELRSCSGSSQRSFHLPGGTPKAFQRDSCWVLTDVTVSGRRSEWRGLDIQDL